MLRVLIPNDTEFGMYESKLKKLYEDSQEQICDSNSFEFIRDNTLFYMFLNDNDLVGAIYFFRDEDKLFLNGFAFRKHHFINLSCLRLSLSWFKPDIYAEAQNRASALCLIKCGFKRVEGNLFVYKHDFE